MSEGGMNEFLYNVKNGVFTPNMDLYIYNWTGDVDPTFMLSIFLTDQINNWSDCAWSDPQYDRLYNEQITTLDAGPRKQIIWKMEQVAYRESPYIVLAYPMGLEAVNTSRWEGWVQSPVGGSAIYSVDNIDSYLFVHPKGAAKTQTARGGVIALIVAGVAMVAGAVSWFLLRRRRRVVEE